MATIKLVVDAILALQDRTGSSVIAINKWIESEKDTSIKKHIMKQALKTGVEKGTLVQVKNSYKVSADHKKAAKKSATAVDKPKKPETKKKAGTTTKKAPSKKAAPKKKPTTKKSSTGKKTTTKKASTKKTPTKKTTTKKTADAKKTKTTTKKTKTKKA